MLHVVSAQHTLEYSLKNVIFISTYSQSVKPHEKGQQEHSARHFCANKQNAGISLGSSASWIEGHFLL